MRAPSDVIRETTLPAPPEQVWAALTESAQLSAWFGARAHIDARPGGRASFCWADGSSRDAVVEVVERPRHLVLRWLPFERRPDGAAVPRQAGRVRFTLTAAPEGSRLIVEESGPAATEAPSAAPAPEPPVHRPRLPHASASRPFAYAPGSAGGG